jgi:hypothetical protein
MGRNERSRETVSIFVSVKFSKQNMSKHVLLKVFVLELKNIIGNFQKLAYSTWDDSEGFFDQNNLSKI